MPTTTAPTTSTHDDVQLAGDLVTHAARLIRTMRRRHDIGAAQRVLSVLDQLGPSTITALAAAYPCSQPTMSGLVSQLDEQGWLHKGPHPDDTRASLVTLTDTGAEALAEVRQTYGADVVAVVADHPTLTTEELATAVRVLRELTTHLSTGDTTS